MYTYGPWRPILYSKLIYKMGQELLDMPYAISGPCRYVAQLRALSSAFCMCQNAHIVHY